MLHKVVNKLLKRSFETPPQIHDSLEALAETFVDFLCGQIRKMQNELLYMHTLSTYLHENVIENVIDFTETTEEEVKKLILDSLSNQCYLDPMPNLPIQGIHRITSPCHYQEGESFTKD